MSLDEFDLTNVLLVYSRRLTHLLFCPHLFICWVNWGAIWLPHVQPAIFSSGSGKCKENSYRSTFVGLDFLLLVWISSQDAKPLSTLSSVGGPWTSPTISGLNKCRLFHKPRQILYCVILQSSLTLYTWRIPQDYLALPEIYPFQSFDA